MNQTVLISALCAGFIAVAGCQSSQVKPEQYSGFLKDYSRLTEQQSPSGADVMRWVDPDLIAERYTSVYIEPSQLYPQPQPTARLSAATFKAITDYYDVALKREISKSLPLAKGPGPSVMVIRPAITAVSSSTESLKPYEILPIALVYVAASTATGSRDQSTEIATEADFLDGGNQQVLAQVVRKGAGKDLENDKQVLTVNDVKPVIDGWAADMNQSFMRVKVSSNYGGFGN
ncbi:MAG: DUF3313 domain-containing protein [Pseudomonas sp.]